MKKTLAMIVKNEEPMLRRTLPVMAPLFDEIVAVDTGSTDGTAALFREFGASSVKTFPWTGDYSRARNEAIRLAIESSGEAIFMFDADEAVYPEPFAAAVEKLKVHQAIVLPRIEFVFDLDHYNPDLWPDYQCRFFRADASPRFLGRVHELLMIGNGFGARAFEVGHRVDTCPIYHYGQTKPIGETVLRHYNYGLISEGRPPESVLPDGVPIVLNHRSVRYQGKHPLSKSDLQT